MGDHVNRSSGMIRGLLVFAVLWGLLLILASEFLPVVTVLTGKDGPQPRQTLVEAHGGVAIVPAVVGLVVTLFVGWLLGWGRGAETNGSLAAARFIGVLVGVVAVAAVI